MNLHFRAMGSGDPLIILHGLFGSADNWQTIGKQFSQYFKVYLVDQRNHGLSPHADEFTYQAMAGDLLELMDQEGLERAGIMGHSMGGKTAMKFAATHGNRVEKLVVVDISPKYYPPHHQKIFAGFHAADIATLTSRSEADERIAREIREVGVRQFLLKNLTRNEQGKFSWKMNLHVIEEKIGEVGKGLEENERFDGKTLFLAGEKSGYITTDDREGILAHFPNAAIDTIENAGHWIHAEQPERLMEKVLTFLTSDQ
ncbi:MAG: alpha/beta fold hydrolase [Cyclobacteriaceae bacterium]|nr:alpha/beta fold hydrolase [Cyclobacteriaceae bacterium]